MGNINSIKKNCEEQTQDPTAGILLVALDKARKFYNVGALKMGVTDLCSIVSLLRHSLAGTYKVDPTTFMVLGGAIIYIVTPCDAIPDVIPIVGYLDDAWVFRQAVNTCISEIRRFQEWEKNQ